MTHQPASTSPSRDTGFWESFDQTALLDPSEVPAELQLLRATPAARPRLPARPLVPLGPPPMSLLRRRARQSRRRTVTVLAGVAVVAVFVVALVSALIWL